MGHLSFPPLLISMAALLLLLAALCGICMAHSEAPETSLSQMLEETSFLEAGMQKEDTKGKNLLAPFQEYDKWDGKVFGAPTYSVKWTDLVKAFFPADNKVSAGDIVDGLFKSKLFDSKHGESAGDESTNLHIIDWWKLPMYLKYTEDQQTFWPQSNRDKCIVCTQMLAPGPQYGILNRFAPMLSDGSPNLFIQNYGDAFQMEWLVKRCPTYLSDMCYRPDGFGFTLMSPCPLSIVCSTCLGIPPQYCLGDTGGPN